MGGKDSPSTAGIQAMSDRLGYTATQDQRMAQQFLDMANNMYQYGRGQYEKYTTPVLDQFLQVIGLAPQTGAGGAAGVSPPPSAAGATTPLSGATTQPQWYVTSGGRMVPASEVDTASGIWLGSPNNPVPAGQMSETAVPLGPFQQQFATSVPAPPSVTSGAPIPGSAGSYMNPMASTLFQLPTAIAGQQAGQAKQSIMSNDALGPAMKSILSGNVDIQKMQGLQTSAYQLVQGMLSSLTGSGQQAYSTGVSGYGTGGGLAANMMGQTAGALSSAGGLQAQIYQAKLLAQQQQNSLLGGIFNTIGSIGGLALGGWLGM